MEKLTTFSILIHYLLSITNGQMVRDLFYQKPGWSNSPERPQDCTFPCYDMSNKMLNFDIIVSLDEDCPKLEGNMEIKPFQKMSPCDNEEAKLEIVINELRKLRMSADFFENQHPWGHVNSEMKHFFAIDITVITLLVNFSIVLF